MPIGINGEIIGILEMEWFNWITIKMEILTSNTFFINILGVLTGRKFVWGFKHIYSH